MNRFDRFNFLRCGDESDIEQGRGADPVDPVCQGCRVSGKTAAGGPGGGFG